MPRQYEDLEAMDRAERRSMRMLLASAVLAMGGAVTGAVLEDSAKQKMADTFTEVVGNMVYTLEGAHAVTASYEGRNYTYNFDNKTVLGGSTEHVGFGGGGYGGMESFANFEDKAAIELARAHACAIAKTAQTAENPGWPVSDAFAARQAKARDFALKYCP